MAYAPVAREGGVRREVDECPTLGAAATSRSQQEQRAAAGKSAAWRGRARGRHGRQGARHTHPGSHRGHNAPHVLVVTNLTIYEVSDECCSGRAEQRGAAQRRRAVCPIPPAVDGRVLLHIYRAGDRKRGRQVRLVRFSAPSCVQGALSRCMCCALRHGECGRTGAHTRIRAHRKRERKKEKETCSLSFSLCLSPSPCAKTNASALRMEVRVEEAPWQHVALVSPLLTFPPPALPGCRFSCVSMSSFPATRSSSVCWITTTRMCHETRAFTAAVLERGCSHGGFLPAPARAAPAWCPR